MELELIHSLFFCSSPDDMMTHTRPCKETQKTTGHEHGRRGRVSMVLTQSPDKCEMVYTIINNPSQPADQHSIPTPVRPYSVGRKENCLPDAATKNKKGKVKRVSRTPV